MLAPSLDREDDRQESVGIVRAKKLGRQRRIDGEALEHVGPSVNFSKEF
jgi:hypothetical protein